MVERDMKKTDNECLRFGDINIKKKEFHGSKKAMNVSDIDIKKILISCEFVYGKKKKKKRNE